MTAPATPDDFRLASEGELPALRRLRDHWFDLSTGSMAHSLLPRDEALPQPEMLAELAAARGYPEDRLALIASYQVRVETLEQDWAVFETLLMQAIEANDLAGASRWSSQVAECDARLRLYRGKQDQLVDTAINGGDVCDAAIIVRVLTDRADSGDERAVGMLQTLVDAVSPERAKAIQAEVQKMEKEAAQ
jgi:hypothetical protein